MRGMALQRFACALVALPLFACSLEYDSSEPGPDIGHARGALEDVVVFPTTTFVDEYSPNQNFVLYDRYYVDYWGIELLRVSDANATAIRQAVGAGLVRRAYVRVTVDDAAWDPYTLRIFRMKEGVQWEPAGATWNCPIDTAPTNGTQDCTAEWDFKATDPGARPHVVTPSDEVTLTALPPQFGTIDLDVTGDVMRLLAGQSMTGWAIRYDAPADPYSFLMVDRARDGTPTFLWTHPARRGTARP
ncbi:MAG: hypothetical protein IT378_21805 [Sandaracinaceae bacterium]|nr:hypothetical protein [Sandaracinaceae bacterium]